MDGIEAADPEGAEPAAIEGPYLLNLHGETWDAHLDRAARWLAHVITAQTAFRNAVEIAVPKVEEPNIRQFLSEILDRARRHEEVARRLPRAIGREAAEGTRGLAGVATITSCATSPSMSRPRSPPTSSSSRS